MATKIPTTNPPGAIVQISDNTRNRIATAIDDLLTLLDRMDSDIDLEPGTWLENFFGRLHDALADENCEDDGSLEPNGDERDCNLAGASSDLELDAAYYEGPGFIEGGQGL